MSGLAQAFLGLSLIVFAILVLFCLGLIGLVFLCLGLSLLGSTYLYSAAGTIFPLSRHCPIFKMVCFLKFFWSIADLWQTVFKMILADLSRYRQTQH